MRQLSRALPATAEWYAWTCHKTNICEHKCVIFRCTVLRIPQWYEALDLWVMSFASYQRLEVTHCLIFMYPYIISITVNDDQQDATV